MCLRREIYWGLTCALVLWVGIAEQARGAESNVLVVASLHPILTDVARQVGGERVRVIGIMKPGEDEHAFRPSPEDLRSMRDASLVLASGKGLERYLDDVRGALLPGQRLLEVGHTIPGLGDQKDHALFHHHGLDHGHGEEDPHWWHSIASVGRAARIIATALAEAQPEEATGFRARESAYRQQLEALDAWVRGEVGRLPLASRKLATAHTAFAYFCRDYDFVGLSIQGLTAEQEPSPAHLRAMVDTIRTEQVRAIFPEVGVNPKILENMVRETGVRVGGHLMAGSPAPEAPTYDAMVRHNVQTIVDALIAP